MFPSARACECLGLTLCSAARFGEIFRLGAFSISLPLNKHVRNREAGPGLSGSKSGFQGSGFEA